MPNQIRPCTLPAHWKQAEPFDAMKIGTFLYRPVPYHTQTKKKTEYRIELFINDSDSIFSPPARDKKELEQYKFEAITTIAEALNAPVLAGKEVVKGLTKDMKLRVVLGDDLKKLTWFDYNDAKGFGFYDQFLGEAMGVPFRIIADKDDPKTAEYLRQFTLDGVRIKEGM